MISEAMEGGIRLLYGLCEVVVQYAKSIVECAAEMCSSESWVRETGFPAGNESFWLVYRAISEQAVQSNRLSPFENKLSIDGSW